MRPIYLFFSVSLIIFGCSAAPKTKDQGHSKVLKELNVEFRSDRLIEVAFWKVKPGKDKEINERYFSKAFPLAQKYGLKKLITFKIDKTEHGPDQAKQWGFFEWPSQEKYEAFQKDPDYQKLRPIRDSLMSSLKLTLLKAKETKTVKIEANKRYEVFGAWLNRHNAKHLGEYFKVAGPFVQSRGANFPVDFEIVGSPENYYFKPHKFGFVAWPDASVKKAWFDSEDFRKVGYHRALAIDQLYVVEGHAILAQAK